MDSDSIVNAIVQNVRAAADRQIAAAMAAQGANTGPSPSLSAPSLVTDNFDSPLSSDQYAESQENKLYPSPADGDHSSQADGFHAPIAPVGQGLMDGNEDLGKFEIHPLVKANIPDPPPMKSINLQVAGDDGYELTTITEGDSHALHALLEKFPYNGPVNVKKPYTNNSVYYWFRESAYFADSVLDLKTNENRHFALYSMNPPFRKSIPFQVIRYNGELVGHCALTAARSIKREHPTKNQEYVKLTFLLSPEHRQKKVMFKACQKLLTLAAKEYDVSLVYATSDLANVGANVLLQKLMDWSEAKWGPKGEYDEATLPVQRENYETYGGNGYMEVRRGKWWMWKIGGDEKMKDVSDDEGDEESKDGEGPPLQEMVALSLGSMSPEQ